MCIRDSHNNAAVFGGADEAVVLFTGHARQRLEPVGIDMCIRDRVKCLRSGKTLADVDLVDISTI